MNHILRIEFTRPVNKILPIFSYGIRAVQRTQYSHVRIVFYNSRGVKIVYEASGSSVKFLGTVAQESHKVEVIKSYEMDLSKTEFQGLVDLCLKYSGISYGKLQIIGMLWSYIFSLDKNPFADDGKSQVCSELVGRFLEEVMGFEIDVNLDVAGPREIDEFLDRCAENGLVRRAAIPV